MPLQIGEKLGNYQVIGPLGKGGMGEVYRALDTQLDREVAVKVLPASMARDPERLARFDREAKILAALNHPNIAVIYGIVDSAAGRALVMELVPGDTLGARIKQGPMPVEEALAVARQMAEALEAAHEKGVTHRDLKPGNVMITPAGLVKVLDFGLAAMAAPVAASIDPDNSPTLTMGMTQAGAIMGTAAYMSPEQAAGVQVDRRADIWSYGVVLYEMVTGKRLFGGGESISHTLADVLRAPIDLSGIPAGRVRTLLRRCLDRSLKTRLQSIAEARIAIDEPESGAEAPRQAESLPHKGTKLPWIAAAVLGVVAVVAGTAWWSASRPVEQGLIRISGDLGADAIAGANQTVAISPDGKRIVYPVRSGGKLLLATRLLDQATPTLLSGTDGATVPFFSPDGQWIGFGAEGKLKKISVLGGAAVTLCDAPALRGASWGEDGNIIVALNSTPVGLSRVSDSGGQPQTLTKPQDKGDQRHFWPQLLPDGNAVLFAANAAGNWDTANVDVLGLKDDGALKAGEIKILVRGGYSPHYLPGPSGGVGHLVYIHEGVLLGVPFDPVKLELRGTPVPLVEGVAASPGPGGGQFDVSRTGSLVYLAGTTAVTGVTFSWMDSSGKIEPLLAKPDRYIWPRLSPDGNLLAISLTAGKGYDLYVYDWRHDTMPRLTFNGAENREAEWSPDGKHLVYDAADGLWWIRADGGGQPQQLLKEESGTDRTMNGFSPDGKRVSYSIVGRETQRDLYTLPLDLTDPEHPKAGKPEVFLATPAVELFGRFSPDGRWMAYVSNESGRPELYVRPFPGPGGKWQISNEGGNIPVWSRDGRQIFYTNPEVKIMVSDYTAKGDSFSYSKPRVWADTALNGNIGVSNYFDIAPDGKRSVVVSSPGTAQEKQGNLHATFLLNFADEVRRRVAVGK
jgi:Tol biopolymer transport system component/tRNA A-37 threonylcarbamoyl transferase component Bud32